MGKKKRLNVSDERIIEVILYAEDRDIPKACRRFGLADDTVKRYMREAKDKNIMAVIPPKKKILIFDIETAPMLGYFWSIWKQNISTVQILEEWNILSWAAKWLDEPEIYTDASWLHGKNPRQDKGCCKTLAKILGEADIVVAHNGDKFDIKKVNTRLLFHDLQEPEPFKSIDTLKIAKRRFAITSNRLDYIGEFLGLGRKVKHEGIGMWNKVLAGCKESQNKMIEYNVGDIVLLEQVYLKLRSWDKVHPNVNIQFSDRRCPVCGSKNLKDIDDVYTPVSKFCAKLCNDCGKYSRTGQHKKSREDMARTQRNII